jgi:cytochrome b561
MPTVRYSHGAIILHWVIALLITVNICLAWAWPLVADESVRPLINNHKSIGVTVLALVIMRLIWRMTHRPPALPDHHQPWEKRAAHGAHIALYIIMFALPLTGWIMDSAWEKASEVPMYWFGSFEWPRIGLIMSLDPATKKQIHDGFGAAHGLSGNILYLLVALHVAGALKHQFIDKDRELARMGIGRSDPKATAPRG